MTEKATAWFERLVEREPIPLEQLVQKNNSYRNEYDHDGTVEWLLEAEAAFDAVFPSQHPLRKRWDAIIASAHEDELAGPYALSQAPIIDNARPVVRVARTLLQSRSLASLVEGIRAETVVEVLEQAEQLNRDGWRVPAAVLAGGALETHLRHLCERTDPSRSDPVWTEPGAIDKYKAALDRARKAGNEVISKGDAKQVTAWADDRNTAAHDPTKFTKGADAVQLMIEGIRQFIARTSAP